MNIFFDTEFTGLVPNTTLISIGMVAETGETFYAEFTDFNEKLVDDWQLENVFSRLMVNHFRGPWPNMTTNHDLNDMVVIGDSEYVADRLFVWLDELRAEHDDDDPIQLVSDVCHYDMVLFCNLFGGAMELPKWINPVCHDICQDICAQKETSVNKHSQFMQDAFDISREALCKKVAGKLPDGFQESKKHNALYDALVIKLIYEGMRA